LEEGNSRRKKAIGTRKKEEERRRIERGWDGFGGSDWKIGTWVDQPKGIEIEPVCSRLRTGRYRVIAINKSGVGEQSNTVMVVL